MIEKTKIWRRLVLDKVNHNVALIPEELIDRDYQTDSLLNKPFPRGPAPAGGWLPKSVTLELQRAFSDLFGFPHVIPVSQGRVAEAMLCRLLVSNGSYIPGSALFPTTRIHQQINGGTCVEAQTGSAYDNASEEPFKGDLDLSRVEETLRAYHPRWCPFICVEPCNNATGGHPVSMANMRALRELAGRHGVRVYLDATRLLENAFLIQEREPGYRDVPVRKILLEFCSYADGCTVSATKDFPTPVGGFFATRDETLYHEAMDFALGFGSGLSYEGKALLLEAVSNPDEALRLVRERMRLVRILHEALDEAYPLVRPAGGHAVYLDAARLALKVPADLHPLKSFLHYLYLEHGIRAAENLPSDRQKESGVSTIRFAVPILVEKEASLRATAADLLKARERIDRLSGLRKTGQPPGLTGALRAQFKPVAV